MIGTPALPGLDLGRSPYTGWTRAHWVALADTMLAGARSVASPNHALLTFPGAPGGYGTAVDQLEGFARTFMLAAFRIAGDPDTTGELAEWYAAGLSAGVDPRSSERWVRPDELDQAKVEAAALAIGLHLTRDTLWAGLDPSTQANVVAYLQTVIGQPYPPINWVWFRIVVEQFLASVGAEYRQADIEEDLSIADGFFRADGWLSDGSSRAYDHYTGWALHLYPVLWAGMVGDDPRHAERIARYRAALDRFLPDAAALVGGDGSPLIQGRSLTYRFAAVAPFWAAALAGSDALAPGLIRRAASGIVSHFVGHGAPDERGRLSLGWHHEWRPLAQSYSGPGSPYWASKGMLGLALPADHEVWTAVEEALPVEHGDVLRVIVAPGWVVSGTSDDGIVRVVNHGTDHGHEGTPQVDPPLYARFGYSTATSPMLGADAELAPFDGAVVLLDEHGAPSHRSGFERGELVVIEADDGTPCGVASSTARAHWIDELPSGPDHGDGRTAERVRRGPLVETVSVVRGEWEVRFVRVLPTRDADVRTGVLRVGGWTVSGRGVIVLAASTAALGDLTSTLVPLAGFGEASVREDADVTPLGPAAATPWVQTSSPVEDSDWRLVAVRLARRPDVAPRAPIVHGDTPHRRVEWPDGASVSITLPSEVRRAEH
jgi:hypothetical protein